MKRRFQRIRDDRFPRTTSEHPLIEVRNDAELLETTERERESLSAVVGLPAAVREPVLIATPALENDANH
jgi:hypothetical protein